MSCHSAPAEWKISAGMIAVDERPSSSSTTVTSSIGSSLSSLALSSSAFRARPLACVNPPQTQYLFYFTDRQGVTHFETNEQDFERDKQTYGLSGS